MLPSIFNNNLFDDFFGFPFYYDNRAEDKAEKKLYGHHAANLMKTDIRETDDAKAYRLAVELKKKGKHLMAYSGYTFEELMQLPDPYVKKLLGELDLLVDGRFIMEQKNIDLRFRGSANQRVLDVPKSLEAGAPVWAEQYR